MAGKIRILIADDSVFFRSALVKGFSKEIDFEVVGEAFDPYDARDKILDFEPDIMTLDIEMPYMNGIEFLKVLLPQWPIPVIVVSSAAHYAAEALRAGAQDFMAKPKNSSPESLAAFTSELSRRIRLLAKGRHTKYLDIPRPVAAPPPSFGGYRFNGIIALGASTGGTQSTAKILKALPGDLPGMVIVQHMPPDFTRMYAENLDKDCALKIKEARDGDLVEKGVVLIAPGGTLQMEVVKRGAQFAIKCYAGEKVSGHCPSVDVLFHSMAKNLGRNALGIILTGMGADGAAGLLAMRKAGAHTLGQDEKSCIVYGMPREAYEMGAVARQAPLNDMASLILNYCRDLRT